MSPAVKRSLKEIGFSGAVAVAFSVGASVATTNAQIARTNERVDSACEQIETNRICSQEEVEKLELFQELLDERTRAMQLELASTLSSMRSDISWIVATLNEMKQERLR